MSPIPNHCIECDKPTMDILCDKCKEKEMKLEDEEPMSNCCTAPFGHPGWPDNDICSKCGEHAGVDEDE